MHKLKIKYVVLSVAIGVFLLVTISFVDKNHGEQTCRSIIVNIDNQYENYFVSEKDVVNTLHAGGKMLVGARMNELNLRQIEARLEEIGFVRNAEAFKDLKGNLIITIDQSRPVARMMGRKLPDRYISAYGDVLPVSENFTARVMLVSGPWADNPDLKDLKATENGRRMLDLIDFITGDPFWKSQIAEIYVNRKGEVTFYTQVSKQRIEFGKPENIEAKFKKLKIFYKEILPAKGWNTYERVNLKYNNQIVCE